MKIVLLFVTGILLFLNSSAQKLKTTITSGGDTLYNTPDEKIYAKPGAPRSIGEYLKTSIYKSGTAGSPILQFEIQTGRTSVFTIAAGSATDITLKDGSVITLYSRNSTESRRSSLDYGCFIFVFYTLRSSDIQQLKASPIKSIRVHASVGPMDYEIKEKHSTAISDQLEKISK